MSARRGRGGREMGTASEALSYGTADYHAGSAKVSYLQRSGPTTVSTV